MVEYNELVRRPRPVMRTIIGVGLLIVLGVLIWILIASNRNNSTSQAGNPASSGSAQPAPVGSSQSSPAASSAGTDATTYPSGQQPPPNSPSTTTAPGPTPATSAPPLADSGPGETLALFTGVSLLAAALHYHVSKRSRRRAAR